jgi:hypothetical protein
MAAGIAMKPGNAGEVKAATTFARGWTNINYTAEVEARWQET